MATIKLSSAGNVILKNGSPSCACCDNFELSITYDWRGTDQFDLDSNTQAFGESVGYACGGSGTYVQWLPGGDGAEDDTSQNGFERVDVRVDQARIDSLWTSSYNIECFSGWYIPAGGSGSATLTVTYKGDTKSLGILPGSQSGCAATPVATITVYDTVQGDGTFFEIT